MSFDDWTKIFPNSSKIHVWVVGIDTFLQWLYSTFGYAIFCSVNTEECFFSASWRGQPLFETVRCDFFSIVWYQYEKHAKSGKHIAKHRMTVRLDRYAHGNSPLQSQLDLQWLNVKLYKPWSGLYNQSIRTHSHGLHSDHVLCESSRCCLVRLHSSQWLIKFSLCLLISGDQAGLMTKHLRAIMPWCVSWSYSVTRLRWVMGMYNCDPL